MPDAPPPAKKGVKIAGKEIPTPVAVGGGVLALYLLYHWWKGKKTASSSTTSTANPAAGGVPGPRGPAGPPGKPGAGPCGPEPPHQKRSGYTMVCAGGKWVWKKNPSPKGKGTVPPPNHKDNRVPIGKGPVSNAHRPTGAAKTAAAPAARKPRIVPEGGTHDGGHPAAHRANGAPAARPAGTNKLAYRDYRMPAPPTPPPPAKKGPPPTKAKAAPKPAKQGAPAKVKAASKPSTGKKK